MQSHASLINYKRYHCLHLQVRKFKTTSKPNKTLKYTEVYVLLFGGVGRRGEVGKEAWERIEVECVVVHNTILNSDLLPKIDLWQHSPAL